MKAKKVYNIDVGGKLFRRSKKVIYMEGVFRC